LKRQKKKRRNSVAFEFQISNISHYSFRPIFTRAH